MTKLVIGNLKMNLLTIAERNRYMQSLQKECLGKNFSACGLVVCPPSVHLEAFCRELLETNGLQIGVQNIFGEERGSFTGEISAPMVKELGVSHVIVGHSERRRLLGETNADANLKVRSALKNGLSPIYCIGETAEERSGGMLGEVLSSQIVEGLNGVSVINAPKIILAYEPVWAIGSDSVPSSDEILGVRILVKKILSKMYSSNVAEKVRLVYGGSVKANFVKTVCIDPGLDGVLVGRESLIPTELVKIATVINKEM